MSYFQSETSALGEVSFSFPGWFEESHAAETFDIAAFALCLALSCEVSGSYPSVLKLGEKY